MTTEKSKVEDVFSRETAGLPEAVPTSVLRIDDGGRLNFHIRSVRKRINDAVVRMLAYNDSIPGPTLDVDQGSEITVNVRNDGDELTTVHWHGLRLENRYDGVPHDTQAPIAIGESFTYKVQFPDAGIYWYHPHLREDYAQEMGLYGSIVVHPTEKSFWPAVDREIVLVLDDVLIEDGQMAAFKRSGPTHTAMGRFGNVLLINGETQFSDKASAGEIVRLYLVNTANTRIFNLSVRGARMKLVGGDSGRHEREEFVDEVLVSPSERAVVDVLFESEGEMGLEHRTPEKVYPLGSFSVEGIAAGDSAASFETLRVDPELSREREAIEPHLKRPPDKTLAFVASMPLLYGDASAAQVTSYACPMHPDVTAAEPGRCPKCGMTLIGVQAISVTYSCPMHPDVTASEPSTCPKCGMKLVVAQTAAAAYSCPMHPDVTATEPGTCSKCGMKLVVAQAATVTYTCPMHPDVKESEPSTCPKCGMKLVVAQAAAVTYSCPMHPEVTAIEPSTCSKCGMKLVPAETQTTTVGGSDAHADHSAGHGEHEQSDGIEWEDLMPEINRASDNTNMFWKLTDRDTGHENGAIYWDFKVGDRVKIRLVNEMDSDHPMHHPFHIHGAGRFLVLSRNGETEPNLAWKDTVLVRMGETVDILLDVSNPGIWMAHCHIAEHIESGMMFSFNVARASA